MISHALPDPTTATPSTQEACLRWATLVDSAFQVDSVTVRRRRTAEVLDPIRPRIELERQLAAWIYADVHLRGAGDPQMPRNSLDHPWLTELATVAPPHYPSTGWRTLPGEHAYLVQRDGVRVRVHPQDHRLLSYRRGNCALMLPRLRPLHTYGWHFLYGAAGGPQGAPTRFYVPALVTHPDITAVVAALDSHGCLWQLKFLADPASRRPDRVVLYTSASNAPEVRQLLSRLLLAHGVDVRGQPGPGFSIDTAPGVHETLPHHRSNSSFGLTIALLTAQLLLERGGVDADALRAHLTEGHP